MAVEKERKPKHLTHEAVLAAIAEYDAIGRDEFLAKYGFGSSRAYWLHHEGRRYDSKAVAGAAFGYLPGSPKPLTSEEFNGGYGQTTPILQSLGFVVIKDGESVSEADKQPVAPREPATRNPAWRREELILALELYQRHGGSDPGPSHPDVVALSETLRRMATEQGLATFRNPQGVAMKLMNFRSLDPAFIDKGGAGLKKIGKLDRVIWEEFFGRPLDLTLATERILVELNDPTGEVEPPYVEGPEYVGKEGKRRYRIHLLRERDRRLIVLRKQAAMRQHGKLACEGCGFDFSAPDGARGLGYVEAHHINPLREMEEGAETRQDDLALLCANCHRMVHRHEPWLSLEELQLLVSS